MKKISMLFCIVTGLFIAGCQSKTENEKEKTEKLAVTTAIRVDTSITNQYVSQIRSIQNIELRALEKGYIQGIFVDEGKLVKKGQRMFQILPNIYEAELMKTEAEVRAAEIEVSNAKSLADKNIVSKNELYMAEANLQKAQAERQLAKVHLGFTDIRAPFTGIMDRLRVKRGSLVNEGDLLTSLSDNSKMWVYFNVPEAEYLNYKSKATNENLSKVRLLMANGKIFKYPGVVETIEGEFNNETGNIAFRATFPNPEGLLRHGETGNVQITVPLKNALLIPQKATFEILDKTYVFVLDKNNRIHSRIITIGAELPHLFAVTSGLADNDKILLEGLRKVKENDKIEIKFEKPEEVITHLNLYAE